MSGFPSGDGIVAPDYDQDEYIESRFPSWEPFTPDSSKIFFVVQDNAFEVGDTLYVVDLLDAQPTPIRIDLAPCDTSSCGRIFKIGAQAPR
jgi:hypothetical protein